MKTIPLPSGADPDARPGHLAHGRIARRARRRSRRGAAAPSSWATGLIDTAEMYGEGGAEEVVGPGGGRCAARRRRAARRAVRRQQGLPAQRQPQGHGGGLRAQPQAPAASTGSTCTCCTGAASMRWPRPSRRCSALVGAGPHRALGRQQFRRRRHGGAGCAVGGTDCAANQVYFSLGERGAEFGLLPWLRAQRHAADGLQPDRPGSRWRATRRLARSAARAGADGGAARAGLGAGAARRRRDPEGGAATSTCATTWRRPKLSARAPKPCAASTPSSRRRAASSRWR